MCHNGWGGVGVKSNKCVKTNVSLFSSLLSSACATLQKLNPDGTGPNPQTPKWMTPMLLFIDLHEKVVLGMNRRSALSKVRV